MFIVEIIGGLGNQMFQYAFALSLKSVYGDTISIYTGRYNDIVDNQGFELSHVFGINKSIISKNVDVNHLLDNSTSIYNRIRRKLFGNKSTYYTETIYKFDSSVFSLDKEEDIYFSGLWQDESYFKSIKDIVIDNFQFKLNLNKINLDLLQKIKITNSVSVHVRRGDYISNNQYLNILGDVCSMNYYRKSIDFFEKKDTNTCYFIFSDDVNWVRANFNFFPLQRTIFIDHNKGLDSSTDMLLMSNCKHNIIANSTFSWWGAWLNPNPNKLVLAPKKWFKNNPRLEDNNIIPDDWIKIEN